MSYPCFPQQGHRNIMAGMVIDKTALFLNPLRFFITVIIATPDGGHPEILESMSKDFPYRLRYISSTPEWYTNPIAQLAFVIPVGHIRSALQLKFNTANSNIICFEAYCIALRTVEHVFYHIKAFFHTLVRRPSGDGPNTGIL